PQILQHIPFGRVYYDSANTHHEITGDNRTGIFFIETKMPTGMSRSMKSPQPPTWITWQVDDLSVLDKPVNPNGIAMPLRSQPVGGYSPFQPCPKVIGSGDMVRVMMS